MSQNNIQIEASWKEVLHEEFENPYFKQIKAFLLAEKQSARVFPPGDRIFAAFNYTPFDEVKVVIIGQDPYHGFGQANGLCFSVADGIRKPPSLVNIFKEIQDDLGIPIPESGNLEKWAKQGVLLLNATLTVREGQAGSHQGKGWEQFTDKVIKTISDKKTGVVFLLWGNYAKAKEALIDSSKHFILSAPHPSPLARGGFFGCKHFSKTNEILKKEGKTPINWETV
ncbi:MAG TPA: uracil-DNA glycosylase [Bacteroidia bacterium]